MGGYPTIVSTNEFGEKHNQFVQGGSHELNCNFIVDSANGNGLGIRSLKSQGYPGIAAVYMHTSSTPAAGNPNPAAGFILVQFAQGYGGYVGGYSGFVSPVSGTPILVTAGLSVGGIYTIVTVGTTTPAQWQALGLPANVVPAVGISFVAITATVGIGTGAVEVPLATGSGVYKIEGVGDPNAGVQTIDGSGGSLILVCLGPTSSGSTVFKALAPVDGSVIGLSFEMLQSQGPLA